MPATVVFSEGWDTRRHARMSEETPGTFPKNSLMSSTKSCAGSESARNMTGVRARYDRPIKCTKVCFMPSTLYSLSSLSKYYRICDFQPTTQQSGANPVLPVQLSARKWDWLAPVEKVLLRMRRCHSEYQDRSVRRSLQPPCRGMSFRSCRCFH